MNDTSKELYEVLVDAPTLRIAGARRAIGDQIPLTETEAQFLVLDDIVAKVKPGKPAKPPKPETAAG